MEKQFTYKGSDERVAASPVRKHSLNKLEALQLTIVRRHVSIQSTVLPDKKLSFNEWSNYIHSANVQ